jgi:hypothetical protein
MIQNNRPCAAKQNASLQAAILLQLAPKVNLFACFDRQQEANSQRKANFSEEAVPFLRATRKKPRRRLLARLYSFPSFLVVEVVVPLVRHAVLAAQREILLWL